MNTQHRLRVVGSYVYLDGGPASDPVFGRAALGYPRHGDERPQGVAWAASIGAGLCLLWYD